MIPSKARNTSSLLKFFDNADEIKVEVEKLKALHEKNNAVLKAITAGKSAADMVAKAELDLISMRDQVEKLRSDSANIVNAAKAEAADILAGAKRRDSESLSLSETLDVQSDELKERTDANKVLSDDLKTQQKTLTEKEAQCDAVIAEYQSKLADLKARFSGLE